MFDINPGVSGFKVQIVAAPLAYNLLVPIWYLCNYNCCRLKRCMVSKVALNQIKCKTYIFYLTLLAKLSQVIWDSILIDNFYSLTDGKACAVKVVFWCHGGYNNAFWRCRLYANGKGWWWLNTKSNTVVRRMTMMIMKLWGVTKIKFLFYSSSVWKGS